MIKIFLILLCKYDNKIYQTTIPVSLQMIMLHVNFLCNTHSFRIQTNLQNTQIYEGKFRLPASHILSS